MFKKTFPLIFLLFASLAAGAQAPPVGQFNGPGRYEIENVESGLLLDMASEDQESVQQDIRHGRLNQEWDIQPTGNGYFYIRSADQGKVLSLSQGSGREGTHAIVYAQRGGEDQLWQIVPVSPGEFQIISKFGPALDVPHKSHDKGRRLQIWTRTSAPNQRFRLVFISAAPAWGADTSTGLPPPPAGSMAMEEAARACKGEVSHHIADLPRSDIYVDPVSTDAQGTSIVIWKTTRGSSGYCRVDRANRVTHFKIEELSQ